MSSVPAKLIIIIISSHSFINWFHFQSKGELFIDRVEIQGVWMRLEMHILTLCLLVLVQLVFVNCSDRNNCDETVDNWEKWVPTYNTCHLYLYSIRYLCYPCAQVPVSSHRNPRPRRRGQVQPRQCSHRPGQELPEPKPRKEVFHCQLLCRLPKWPRLVLC